MRAHMIGVLILMMIGILLIYSIIKLVQALKDILILLIKGVQLLLHFACCFCPKGIKKIFLILKVKYQKRKRTNFTQLPM